MGTAKKPTWAAEPKYKCEETSLLDSPRNVLPNLNIDLPQGTGKKLYDNGRMNKHYVIPLGS